MSNIDLITTIARRLDKFSFDEMVIVSESSEIEIKEILSILLKKQVILQNGDLYFFNNKKLIQINNNNNNSQNINSYKPIIIEDEDGYKDFLKYGKDTQEKIKRYVELINFVNKAGGRNLKNLIELFNQISGYKKIPYSSFTKIHSNFKKYGFKGILPAYSTTHIESSIPEDLYVYFKKYYLTKEKLSATEAIFRAQNNYSKSKKLNSLMLIRQLCFYEN